MNMSRAHKRQAWMERISNYRNSGLSIAAWCAAHQLSTHALRYWLRNTKNEPISEQSPQGMPSNRWLRVDAERLAPPTSAITIRIGSATVEVKEGFHPHVLREIVQVLASC